MSRFAGKVAIVTGGASGIGRSLVRELLRHGARVVVADLNGAQAEAVAAAGRAAGGVAEAAPLDVRDPDAVRDLVERTAREHGRLDLMFNNAGVALFGEVRDMTVADWDHLIDVNLRGVVHGVAAAYPLMIRQGGGHIVNTASLAGLAPAPGATAYAATKHAVVGLSTSLRAEAARFGVRVSAACPGFVDTPIVGAMKLLNVERDVLVQESRVKLHSPDACARTILRGVERNRAIIPFTALARLGWLAWRLSPALMLRLSELASRRSPVLDREIASRPRTRSG